MREKFLKLDKERGAIVNAHDGILYVRRRREGKEVFVAPSTEISICKQIAPKEVEVCVAWKGPQCTTWEECDSRKVIEVEICVDYAVPEPGSQHKYWRPDAGQALKMP